MASSSELSFIQNDGTTDNRENEIKGFEYQSPGLVNQADANSNVLQRKRRKRICLMVVVPIVVLAIGGMVAGVVVGTRRSRLAVKGQPDCGKISLS